MTQSLRNTPAAAGELLDSPDATPLTVAVAQRPGLAREALGWILGAAGFEITALCDDAASLLAHVRTAAPQIVIADPSMGPGRPLQVLGHVRLVAPDTRCVALVAMLTPGLALAAVREEVDGVVVSSCSAADLSDAIRQIAAGHAVFPAGWLTLLRRARAESLTEHLSARQLQVLELLSSGMTNGEIGRQLDISLNTVKFHLREIYGRVGVGNRVQAARLLAEHSPRSGYAA